MPTSGVQGQELLVLFLCMFYFIHIYLDKSVLKKKERNIPIMVCEFFHNPQISLKSRCETETEIQAETQTRKHAHDPLDITIEQDKSPLLNMAIHCDKVYICM